MSLPVSFFINICQSCSQCSSIAVTQLCWFFILTRFERTFNIKNYHTFVDAMLLTNPGLRLGNGTPLMCLTDIYTATTCTKWAADKSSNGPVLCGIVVIRWLCWLENTWIYYMNASLTHNSGLIIIEMLLISGECNFGVHTSFSIYMLFHPNIIELQNRVLLSTLPVNIE